MAASGASSPYPHLNSVHSLSHHDMSGIASAVSNAYGSRGEPPDLKYMTAAAAMNQSSNTPNGHSAVLSAHHQWASSMGLHHPHHPAHHHTPDHHSHHHSVHHHQSPWSTAAAASAMHAHPAALHAAAAVVHHQNATGDIKPTSTGQTTAELLHRSHAGLAAHHAASVAAAHHSSPHAMTSSPWHTTSLHTSPMAGMPSVHSNGSSPLHQVSAYATINGMLGNASESSLLLLLFFFIFSLHALLTFSLSLSSSPPPHL